MRFRLPTRILMMVEKEILLMNPRGERRV